MANIPGASNIVPGTILEVVTESRGVAAGSSNRVVAIIGEGVTSEVVVSTAAGNGVDGVNEDYTSTSDADGRHFQLTRFPLVPNRTSIFINGVKLSVLEGTITGQPFSNRYDAMIDPDLGQIELQTAYLVDQGGAFWKKSSSTVGLGTIDSLVLEDTDAPTETWTIRCVSVQRDINNAPIGKTAKFAAFGSSSGSPVDTNGNPVLWGADGYVVSNGILEFAISETESGGNSITPFREGDAFSIKVKGGVLPRYASLTSSYIPVTNLNIPIPYDGLSNMIADRGLPSVDNTLSLGAQLAFQNGAPSVLAVQAAPSMPRRQSFLLSDGVRSTSTNDDDFIFPLPAGVIPDVNGNIHFFIENPATSVETQLLPNKVEFNTLGEVGQPTINQFITDNTAAPGGYSFCYTVIQQDAAVFSGFDGYMARNLPALKNGIFTGSIQFDSTYVGKTLKVIDATNNANNGSFVVTSVTDGKLFFSVTTFADLVAQSSAAFQVFDPQTGANVDGAAGTNGVVVASPGTGNGTLASTVGAGGYDFSLLSNITQKQIRITNGTDNKTLYDITGYNAGTNTLTIAKAFVVESDLRFEVLDTNDTSSFVVINKNVVPNNYGLRVTLIDEKDSTFYDAGWTAALESLEAVECDIVVPLPKQTISVIFQNTVAHCRTMSFITNKKERVAFIGAIRGLVPDNLTGVTPAAVEDIGVLEGIQGDSVTEVLAGSVEDLTNYSVKDGFGSTFRCSYFYPDEIVVNTGSNVIVDGFYQAAAGAGYFAGQGKTSMPLTNKVLVGFTIQRSKLLPMRVQEALASAGVTVLQPVQGGGRVIWGLTTSQSGFVEEKEMSIVFIRDAIAKRFRNSFNGYIGNPEDDTLQASLVARAVVVLNSFMKDLISSYKDLVVVQDASDPTQWNISVRVKPIYPVNFIYIRVSIGNL